MSKSEQVYMQINMQNYITPLFWQHGEEEEILREEIRQMHENGIGGFIVESRLHPVFLAKPDGLNTPGENFQLRLDIWMRIFFTGVLQRW